MSDTSTQVIAPAGVVITPGRETAQTYDGGPVVEGMVFNLTLPSGAKTSVFVPYNLMSTPGAVQQIFTDRVNAINGVTSISV
jgi:hypothetical protein